MQFPDANFPVCSMMCRPVDPDTRQGARFYAGVALT